MKNKIIIFFVLFFLLSACSGMGKKRSENSDEFLIEKKNPLVMPPDIEDLPLPEQAGNIAKEEENQFKESLKSNDTTKRKSTSNSSESLEESIIKKIE